MGGLLSTSNTSIPDMQFTNTDQAFSDAFGNSSNNLYLDLMSTPLQQTFQGPEALIDFPTIWEPSLENQNNLSSLYLDRFHFNEQNSPQISGSTYPRHAAISRSDPASIRQAGEFSGTFHNNNKTKLSDNALLSLDVTETVADHL